RLIRCVCGKKIGPDPRNFNQRVCLGRNDLLIRTFLSEQQVKDIFSGKVSRWNKVGGGDEGIKIWQRPEDSGSQTVMKGLVMQDTPMLPAKKSTVIDLMGGLITEVADYQNTPSSIGYTFHYYVTRMNDNMLKMRKQIKLLAINGVAPTEENIRNGTYPYIIHAYMVTHENPTLETQKFVDWFLSPQGQQLVEDVGYVPIYDASSESSGQ
ncbi:TPA: substrate-binding domain-containing protein, partial [Escherichia coli]